MEMANIESVPHRKFKTKSSDIKDDLENLILTSKQSVAMAEAKKRIKMPENRRNSRENERNSRCQRLQRVRTCIHIIMHYY